MSRAPPRAASADGSTSGLWARIASEQADAGEGLREVVGAAPVLGQHGQGSDHVLGDAAEQLLGEIHQLVVGRVGLVELKHRELGVVARAEPLVPEVPVDLEHPLEAADDEPLEVELGGDAQEEAHVEGVVVGRERLRRGPARDRLHHRRLDLEEVAGEEEVAHVGDDPRAQAEHAARLLVDDEVHVALTVAGLLILQAVVLLGQRPERLGQELERGDPHRELPGVGDEQLPARADDVAEIELLEALVVRLPEPALVDEQLDVARAVAQRREARLAHHALRHHPPGDGDLERLGGECRLLLAAVLRVQVGGRVRRAEGVREGVARLAERGELVAALADQVVLVGALRPAALDVDALAAHGARRRRRRRPRRRSRPRSTRPCPRSGTARAVPTVLALVHCSPAFRLSVRKGVRSPSSTACVLLVSSPVRRSLMRDWSST